MAVYFVFHTKAFLLFYWLLAYALQTILENCFKLELKLFRLQLLLLLLGSPLLQHN